MNFTIILANSQNSKFCWDFYGKCIQFESDGENLDIVIVSIPPLQGLACLLRVWQELVAFRLRTAWPPGSFPAASLCLFCVSQHRVPTPASAGPSPRLSSTWLLRHIECQPSNEWNFIESPKQGAGTAPMSHGRCPQKCSSAAKCPDPRA